MPNPFDFDSVAGANVLDGTKASGGMGFTPPAGLRMPSAQPQQSALQASQQALQNAPQPYMSAPQQQSGVVAYNPQTLEVDTGAGTFSLDNLSVADAHIQKGWLTQPVQQVKPGYIPVAPQEIERLFQEKAQSRGFGSAVAETGRQIWQGFSHDLPSMAIGATRAFADAGGDYDRWGKWAQNTLENDARVPDTYGRGVVSTDLIKGGRALAPSAAAMAATAVNPIVGGALTLGMFGGSQFTDTWDKAKAAGLPDGDAFTAALQTGAIEGLGETLADVAGVKLLSGAAPVLRNLINGGRLSVDQAIKIVTNPSMLKSFSADIAANTAIQAGTEYGQNYGETAVENAYGISKENPHAQGMEGFHSALGLSALMAPLGVPGHYAAAQARAQLGAAIKDYSNPVDLLEASRAVRDEITPLTGEAPAGDWMRNQFNQYNNQYLTGLSNGYRDQYVNNFMDGVNAAPKDFGFEGPEISPVTQYLRGQQMQVNAFSPNNQAVPLPTNVGEAVAAIQQLRNYPIVEGSPEHAAVLEASRILNEAGINLPAPAAPKGQPNASANQELPNAVNPQAALATAVAGVDQGNNPVTNPAGAGQETQPAKIAGEENEAGLTSPRAVALWQRAVNAFGPRAIELEQISQLLAENKFGKVEKMLGEQQAAAAAPTGAVSEDATHNVFEKLLKTLKQRKGAADKQAVMRAWLSEEASLAGIANQFGISKQRVQQVTQEAVQQMIANAKQAGLTAEHAKAMLRGILEASMGSSTAGMTERQQAIASLTGAVQDNYGEVMDFADAAQHGLVVPNRVTQTGTRGANEGEWSDSERQGSEGEKVSETVAEEAPTEDAEPTKDEGEIPLISEETAGEEEPEERSREINATGEGKEVSSADPEQLAKEAADAKARQKADVDKANARIKLLRDAGKVFDSIPLDGMADNVMWEDLNRDQQSRFAEAYDNDATDDELAALAQEIGDEAGHFMGKDGVLFSKNKASEPTTVAALTKKLQKLFFTPKRFADLVVTVQSAEDLTKIPEARSIDVGKDTQGFVYKGKVYLIADNIDKGTELAVFLHELGAHLGLKNLIGESNFHQLALQINEWSGKSGDRLEHRLAQLAMARVDNALQLAEERGEPIDDGTLLEEMVAYFIEEAVNAGVNPMALDKTNGPLREWFRTLWAAVKSALNKLGIGNFDALTAQNIVDLAYGAATLELAESTQPANESSSAKFSKRATDTATPEGFMNTLRGVIEDPVSAFKRNRLGWLTLEQLAEATKSKAVDAYRDALVKMQKFSKDYIYRASGVDQEWAKLSDKQQVTLSNVMRMARRAAFDPAKDSPANPEQTKVKLEYAKLDANGKKVYEAVRDFYAKGFEERKQIMMTLAQKAKDAGKNVKEVEALFAKVKGPYFPFMRLGDWYSVGMSDRVAELVQKRDAGELSSAEREELGKLRKDKKHYWTRSHDTEREAKAAVREMQKAGYANAYHNVQEERLSSELKKHNIDVSSLEESIVEGLDGATRSAVRDMLAQMAFDLLPEHHALKRQMHAELVEGEEENMRRVFAKSAISQAHYISRLKHADDVSAALQVVRNDGRYDVNKRHIYNELNKRTELAMQRTESPIIDKLMGLSYFAHLGMSPAFILTNLSQVPMITAPWLSARFGIGATSSALATALADTSSIMKTSFVGKGKSLLHELNWGNHFKQGSDEDKLLRELTDRNLLDITMEHDLNAVAEMSSSAMDKGFKYMNAPVRISELANRAVTALAAYRLARAHNQSHEEAVNTAAKALSDTQLNYSALNAPRYMQSVLGSKALAKMVFQFRKYQQGMLWLVGSNIYNAVKGDGAEAKYARNTLIGLYGMTGIAAGVTGMPLFGTLAFVLNTIAAAFGDPDDKWDLEVEMRNWLTDHFGKEAAAAIAKGLPMLLGTDLSKRVGMGDIASPLPFFRQGKSTQETAGNLLASAAGAPVATMVDLVDGLSMMASGDWMKGAEKVAPLKMAKDILRASRYGTEGLTSKTGEVVLPSERFNAWDLSLRAMGFSPTKESEYYAANAAVEGAKTAATDVRSKLLRDYAQAKLVEGDYQAVKDKIDAFNDRHPERGVRIDAGALIKAVQQRKRMAEQRDESGVKGDRVTKNFKDQGRFAAP